MARIDLTELDTGPIEHAAAGLRRLTDLLLRVGEDDPSLAAVIEELDRIGELLEQNSGTLERNSSTAELFDPLWGKVNALAPPLNVEVAADGSASATGSLGLAYQGPRGLVHGGVSALILDRVLRLTHPQGSGEDVIEDLSVRYHQPLPLFEDVVITCRQTGSDGQGTVANGEIAVDGRLAVSAEAVFRRESRQRT